MDKEIHIDKTQEEFLKDLMNNPATIHHDPNDSLEKKIDEFNKELEGKSFEDLVKLDEELKAESSKTTPLSPDFFLLLAKLSLVQDAAFKSQGTIEITYNECPLFGKCVVDQDHCAGAAGVDYKECKTWKNSKNSK